MTGFEDKMAQLRERFLARAESDRAKLVAAATLDDRAELRRLAHGLSGSAAVFGFPDIGLDAQALEEAVDSDADEGELRRLCALLTDRLARETQRT
ncbi:MAG TPA: Hpt domain-containing protein [Allosphingosinicella sp.]|nr:Hpt domain-containing protein [Allosphingosinicella sp.]